MTSQPPQVSRRTAAAIGLAAVAITFGIAELIAAAVTWLHPPAATLSPSRALGQSVIALTPEWLKDLAISAFGQHDKVALGVAIVLVAILLAVAVGLLLRIRLWASFALVWLLVAVTTAAVVSRPDAALANVLPLWIGSAVGAYYLRMVAHRLAAAPTAGALAAGTPTAGAAPESGTPASPERRHAVQLTGVTAGGAVVAGLLARVIPTPVDVRADRTHVHVARELPPLPANIDPPVARLTPFMTPNSDFYRVDTAFPVPHLAAEPWELRIHGMVEHPYTITWHELMSMPQEQHWITLACVSNPVGGELTGTACWQGVRLDRVLARAKPTSGADCVLSTSADHFTASTPLTALTDGRHALLAMGMNGAPLPAVHGYPVRMVVPGLYGYVSATKWVVDLEVTRFDEVSAYWTERGWSAKGPVKLESRIDTPRHGEQVSGTVPIAGVAWDPTRGISEVQVRIDEGPWHRADLFGTVSADTWRQWTFRWDTASYPPGDHTVSCRAVSGDGTVQTWMHEPVIPDGASGYDAVPVTVEGR